MAPEFICNIWKVEHGSAAFVRTPNDRTIMLDCGKSDKFSPAMHIASNYKIGRLDKLIISHPHDDHIADLSNVVDFLNPHSRTRNPHTPENLVFPNGVSDLTGASKTWHQMNQQYTHPISGENKLIPDNYGGVSFETFMCKPSQLNKTAATNLNNYSLLTIVEYRGLSIVFPGDLEPDGWDAMMDSNTNLEKSLAKGAFRILVAPHHGRASGIRRNGKVYTRFLEAMLPSLVIISDKYSNPTTDPDAYRGWAQGLEVLIDGEWVKKEVLTTKTKDCFSFQIEGDYLISKAY